MNTSSYHQGKTLNVKEVSGEWTVRSPANHELELGKVKFSYSHIATLTQDLAEAGSAWAGKSFESRCKIVCQALLSLSSARQQWFDSARAELGRTDVDLQAEWDQFERWVGFFKSSMKLDLAEFRRPRGVTAVVGSYVWPLVYSIQSACLALATGNPVVIKPSEKATLCTLKAVELLTQTEELKPLLSVIVGDRELSRRLICHETVQTVIFYGSFEVGIRVKQDTLSQPSKSVLLFLGAKNPSIVFNDAPDSCIDTLIRDAFLSTGQHCRSVSQIWIQDGIYDKFVHDFHEASKKFKIGDPSTGAYAGPLIDPSMLDRYLKFAGISEREGAQILMRGKPLDSKQKGNYVTPTLASFEKITPEQIRKSVALQTEILSPHISLLRFKSESDLGAWFKEVTHGYVASVWTGDTAKARALASEMPFGQVAINQSLLTWDPSVSFQALKKSGNHAYQGPKLLEQLTLLKS